MSDLDDGSLGIVLSQLSLQDMSALALTCKALSGSVVRQDEIWRNVLINILPFKPYCLPKTAPTAERWYHVVKHYCSTLRSPSNQVLLHILAHLHHRSQQHGHHTAYACTTSSLSRSQRLPSSIPKTGQQEAKMPRQTPPSCIHCTTARAYLCPPSSQRLTCHPIPCSPGTRACSSAMASHSEPIQPFLQQLTRTGVVAGVSQRPSSAVHFHSATKALHSSGRHPSATSRLRFCSCPDPVV